MPSPSSRRPMRRVSSFIPLLLTVGLVAPLVGGASVASAAPAPEPAASETPAAEAPAEGDRSSFTLPVLPDTQFYSRYSASQFVPKYGTNPFEVQTEWLVENQDELDVPFVVHVGDVVDQQGQSGEWDAAAKAMKVLTDGGLPYSVIPGNHDVADMNARSSVANSANYLARFGEPQMSAQAGAALIGSFQNGLSTAYLFTAEGHTWMSLALAWNASDDTFAWAQGILDAHPGVPVVLSSHAIINIGLDQVSPASWWWGDTLWDRLIRQNDEIILTVNGHFHGATAQTRTNDFGNPVYQVLTDYQMAADGGNGIMTLFEFDLTNNSIDVETVSPWVSVKDPASLASSDAPVLDGTWQSFSMDLDFEKRFGWTVDPALETGVDLSELGREIVSEGWEEGAAGGQLVAAGSEDDYISVPGTVAHWRFGDVEAGAVDESTEIPDVAGDSPMYRNATANTDAPEELDDLTITHDNTAFYSSDTGAACFDNTTRNATGPDRLSFLSTEYGAPATFADLSSSSGYTIEAFLQLDEDWTESANRWGAAIARGGTREWMGIPDTSDPGASPMWLGISNLREYQYSAADATTRASYTTWSGEIMPDAWHHVAIVNDPVARTAIMYVDGVPVLRNASNTAGMMAADFMPWMIGTSTWNTEPDHGWHGCVGETRVVDHALSVDEFLYNRVDIDAGSGLAVSTDFGSVYDSDATVTTLEGTGHPGSTVRVETGGEPRGSAVVGAGGSWTIELDEPLAGSGAHPLTFVQSIGTRDGAAYEAVLVIGEDTAWAPTETDLTEPLEGRITVTPDPFAPGSTIEIAVPAEFDGQTVYAFAFSEPVALGVAEVSGSTVTMSTPASLALGEHRVALYTAEGDLIGWDSVTAEAVATDPATIEPISWPTAPVAEAGGTEDSPTGTLPATGLDAAGWIALALLAMLAVAAGAVIRARRAS